MSQARYYTGWEIPETVRSYLLQIFVPAHRDVIAHHITHTFGVNENEPLPVETEARIVGRAVNDRVEALVIEIAGTTERPDGKIFHCTWSLDRSRGAKPVMSNALIAESGYEPVESIAIDVIPRRFSMV